ncbi:hypothetical protein D7V86_03060 [bacterium D16-51]|nr:hypothetical protein D7V96_02590 [bacterium D16-59]RKI62106.1 hypothetical protein D7V86_03060 [bacterium D16-51]
MQEYILYGSLFVCLLLEAVIDIRKQKIWLPLVLIEIPVLTGLNYSMGRGGIALWAASFGTGVVIYLVSIVTKEQIGKGDAYLFAMTGAGMGFLGNIALLYLTFFFAFLAALFYWLVKKAGRGFRMPLAPFVFVSYCFIHLCRII